MKRKRDEILEKNLYEAGWILLAAVLLFSLAAEFFSVKLNLPPCVIHWFTGYYCPGCGGTRACMELLQGHVAKAFLAHPVVVYGAGVYLWFMISHTAEKLSGGKWRIGMKYTDGYLYAAAGIIAAQWILKNVVKAVWGIGLA